MQVRKAEEALSIAGPWVRCAGCVGVQSWFWVFVHEWLAFLVLSCFDNNLFYFKDICV